MSDESFCTITSLSRFVYNSFTFIINNIFEKDSKLNSQEILKYQTDIQKHVETLKNSSINIVNTFGYYEFDFKLLENFNFIIKPFITPGQITNIPNLSNQHVYVNHALILLELISPNSIKWHAHLEDINYFCWTYEPNLFEYSDFEEEEFIKNEINKLLNRLRMGNDILYTYSGLLTWSFISVIESPIKDLPSYEYKFDIYGNIINIGKESSLITPLCTNFYKKNIITPNYLYFKYIFYNFYNNKIATTPIFKNVTEFILINLKHSLATFSTLDDSKLIFIILRLMKAGVSKSEIYKILLNFLQIVKKMKDNHIEILLEHLNSNLPAKESDTFLLNLYIECYTSTLRITSDNKLIYKNVLILIENLWELKNIYIIEHDILKIYIKLVKNWNLPCFIHLERILSLAFYIIERDDKKDNNIYFALDVLLTLLEMYQMDMKHYCYDILFRIALNKYNSNQEIKKKAMEVVEACKSHFSDLYTKKCVEKIANLLGSEKNLPPSLAELIMYN